METIKQMIFTNWHFMRWLRLILGGFIAIQAIQNNDLVPGLIGAIFLYQAITNTGCCGANGCAVTPTKKTEEIKIKDIEFEEIK